MSKHRLSATVDADLLTTAQEAVNAGRAASVSVWVNDALRLKVEHDHRLAALDTFLAGYEAKHGAIADDEIEQAVHRARARATVVRSRPRRTRTPRGA